MENSLILVFTSKHNTTARNVLNQSSSPGPIDKHTVFFHNLNPADIPTSDELDNFRPNTSENVMRAMLALDTIFRIRPPPEVGVSLWRHVWPWFYFIHTYWAHLPGIDIVPEKSFYVDFLLFAGGFRELPLSSSVMLATPGFKVIIAKVLSFLPGLEEPNLEAVLDCIYNFIGDFNFSNPANLSELMEGAGGTIDDLAGLVVQYIRIVLGRRPQYIRGICFSLRDAETSLETEQQRSLPPLGALHSILLYHGLVRAGPYVIRLRDGRLRVGRVSRPVAKRLGET
ncbi:hypothetical protein B0H14DRAFT_3151341 [Mycena olivaceomarginata]|nr:hypothetical protein B0H14DRAFT_3151341 [Mycena olivaceomarginata]